MIIYNQSKFSDVERK